MPETSISVRSLLIPAFSLEPVGVDEGRLAEPCEAAAPSVSRDVEAAFGAAR